MSQIAIPYGGGTPAPDAETLTGDVGGVVGVDASFNINLLTGPGLTSTGDPATNTITWTIDGLTQGTATTVGAVTGDPITIDLGATPTTYVIEAKIAGFESTTPAGIGYNLICAARTTGAAASIVNTQDKYVAESAALALCDAYFIAVGNTIVVRVLGVAGLTIRWKASTILMGV
jgi:hypothetical protein